MIRILIFSALLALFMKAEAQVSHACPLHGTGEGAYENPLDQKWLSGYDVKYYDLSLSVSNLNTEITGTATVLMETVREMDTLVLELQDALEIYGITIGQAIDDPGATAVTQFNHTGDAIYIPLDRNLSAGDMLMARIEYGGEASQGRGFFAGISHAVDPTYGFDVTYTLSEPLNARDWFPVKQVLQDQIDSVHMNVECDDHLMVASNGILKEVVPAQEGRHIFRWRTRYPMAYYLLSFAVADYRDLSFRAALSGEGDSVLVQNYIYNNDEVLLDWEGEIRRTAPLITTFSTLLRDYPFAQEKYGHAMAPLGGGMEHQTMTTLQDFSFYLVAHELAHQWFGDYVTCGNWQDIWVNEGFASYMEYVAAQELLGQDAADSWMNNAMSIALGETEGSVFVPQEDVENEYRLFDYGLSYKKGAVLLHMIRYWLSDDELFFGTLKNYLELFGNGLATGEDFREVLEETSGMDFSCFFEQWYYGEGFPRFQLHWSQSGDSLFIRSEQTGSAPQVTPFFKTPFEVKLTYMGGEESDIRLWQDKPLLDTSMIVSGTVEQLEFDPAGWLLKSVSVVNLIPEYGVEKQFVMGPNPVTDELRIRFLNNPRIDRIVVTSITGQQVWVEEDVENPIRMDLSKLTAGPYLLVMFVADRTYRQPFVKLIP